MKKIVNIILVSGAMAVLSPVFAADADTSAKTEVVADSSEATEKADSVEVVAPVEKKEEKKAPAPAAPAKEEKGMHQIIKEKISEGGIEFMSIVLICLIIKFVN